MRDLEPPKSTNCETLHPLRPTSLRLVPDTVAACAEARGRCSGCWLLSSVRRSLEALTESVGRPRGVRERLSINAGGRRRAHKIVNLSRSGTTRGGSRDTHGTPGPVHTEHTVLYCRTSQVQARWEVYRKKTPGGAPGKHTGHARAHTSTWKTQTNLTTEPSKPANTPAQPRDDRIPESAAGSTAAAPEPNKRSPRPTQKWSLNPEEAAPSEPDPAASRSESASPRLLEGGWRNECARSRRVAAGGASGLLEPPMTR